MDERERIKKEIESGAFVANNGALIRVVNILDGEWVRLEIVKRALCEMPLGDFQRALSFCQKAGYVTIRQVFEPFANVEAYRADYHTCEVSLTDDGMRLAMHAITDPAVSV